MLICATVTVPMHVSTDLGLEVEMTIVAVLKKVNEVIEKHKKESAVVIDLMRRLNDDNVNEHQRETIESRLSTEFQTVLLQNGILEGVATRAASIWARITDSDIHFAVTDRGSSIVVYFRCGSVRALYKLHGMITTGFVRVVFTEIIHSLTSSTPTVDVYVKPHDFNFVFSSFTSLQDTGLFWELK